MKINFFKWFSGATVDPKLGTPMPDPSASLSDLLKGRIIQSVFVPADSEGLRIEFSDNTFLYFLTNKDVPRVMYQQFNNSRQRGYNGRF